MNLDILVRGQSNAVLFASDNNYAAAGRLTSEVERLLGFDGAANKVSMRYEQGTEGRGTAYGGTALLGDWMQQDGSGTWRAAALEQSLLNYIAETPQPQSTATAVFWLHSEYDSSNPNLTANEWTAAVRQDAALVRAALGGDAASIPYHFVSAHPYSGGTDAGHQAIRLGMEQLARDTGFNAGIAARMLDIDASRDNSDNDSATTEYGGGHISSRDANLLAIRAAHSIAQDWAAYALPGSPVALAGGSISDLGPQVVTAARVGSDAMRLTVRHDQALGFAPLSPGAESGLGWSVRSAAGVVEAVDVDVLSGNSLLVQFEAPLPQDGVLHFGYGYGRLAEGNSSGHANAVYDAGGVPIWTPAEGLPVTPVAATPLIA